MKLSIADAQARHAALVAEASALNLAIGAAIAAGQTEIDTNQALLDLDTKLEAETQQAIDKLT